jgi:ABC-type multidrug transport system fused ATPase/permease subunit
MIEEELEKAKNSQTRITVAHRLSSLKSTDKIIVLKDGTIEAQGSAAELMQTSPSFRTIVSVQSGSEVNHE